MSWVSVSLFGIVRISQLGVRLLAYTGVLKIGASRSSALQSINPLISATIAIVVLRESAAPVTVVGTLLVVAGIILVSRKAEKELLSFRWWHLLLPMGAAILSGVNHPIRALRAWPVQRTAVFLCVHGIRYVARLRRVHDHLIQRAAARLGSPGALAVCVHRVFLKHSRFFSSLPP